jgi:nucleotide-binding universal stress UspA family protein
MRKVLIAFDGPHFSQGACDYARHMNEQEKILLVGVFLPQSIFSYVLDNGGLSAVEPFFPGKEQTRGQLQEHITAFRSFCEANHIHFYIHSGHTDFALPALQRETRFADLLLIGMESYYNKPNGRQPNEYLEQTLSHAECPVLLVPEVFEPPRTNIITYDGGSSSVFAIKEFLRVFPGYRDNKTTILHLDKNVSLAFPEKELIKELSSCYFQEAEFLVLDINPHKFLSTWLSEHKHSILVSGAFGRSGLSRLFVKSFLDESIAEHQVPVFIAHK